jgi:hypothetical protein
VSILTGQIERSVAAASGRARSGRAGRCMPGSGGGPATSSSLAECGPCGEPGGDLLAALRDALFSRRAERESLVGVAGTAPAQAGLRQSRG